MARRNGPGGKKNPLGESRWDKQQRQKDAWNTGPEAFRFDAKPSDAMPPIANRIPLPSIKRRLNPPQSRWRIQINNTDWCVAIRYFDHQNEAIAYSNSWWARWGDKIRALGPLTWQQATELRDDPWGVTGNQIDQSWWIIQPWQLEKKLHAGGDYDWPFNQVIHGMSMAMHILEHQAARARQRAASSATVTRQLDLTDHYQ